MKILPLTLWRWWAKVTLNCRLDKVLPHPPTHVSLFWNKKKLVQTSSRHSTGSTNQCSSFPGVWPASNRPCLRESLRDFFPDNCCQNVPFFSKRGKNLLLGNYFTIIWGLKSLIDVNEWTQTPPSANTSRAPFVPLCFLRLFKALSLVVLGASFCIQHPRCLIVISPLLKPPFASLGCSTHAQRVGSRVKPIASAARSHRRAASAAFLRPRDSPSFANGTSAAVSGPRTASAALIGCGLQKRSAELSEQPPQQPPPRSISLYH